MAQRRRFVQLHRLLVGLAQVRVVRCFEGIEEHTRQLTITLRGDAAVELAVQLPVAGATVVAPTWMPSGVRRARNRLAAPRKVATKRVAGRAYSS